MKRPSNIAVAGFEYMPAGKLLKQYVDFRDPIGVGYERCIKYEKDYHIHDRVNLTFPRGSSIIKFTTKNPAKVFIVSEGDILWMPENVNHRQDTESVIYDNLAIFPTSALLKEILKNFNHRNKTKIELPKTTIKARRSDFLNELLNRYFFERVLEKNKTKELQQIACQIILEMLAIMFKVKIYNNDFLQEIMEDDFVVARALKFIEANLFSKLTVKDLVEASKISKATLFRRFRADVGFTPAEYIRNRRLDESKQLLITGNYNVADVGILVGYDDLPTFSKAFKVRFKKAPSKYLDHRV